MPNDAQSEALKPLELSLLICLLEGPCHGYALVQRLEEETEGRVQVLPGNLYAVLSRLEEAGWIERSEPPAEATDARRRYYRLSAVGVARLEAETRALERQLGLARSRLAGSRAVGRSRP
ncbi:MAG: PadR family transcriptional regulator [Acidobacteria bacterium]|nr:MAG: PadR family transcriptional regulator [Acidobacteriota bacterium]REK03216.1 MAG: PadR family transcriptional regulator [Acidobacteriota bacterium]